MTGDDPTLPGSVEQMILEMATVIMNAKVADFVPADLRDRVREWLRAGAALDSRSSEREKTIRIEQRIGHAYQAGVEQGKRESLRPDRWDCPACESQGVGVDEDGCCRTCGADAITVIDGVPQVAADEIAEAVATPVTPAEREDTEERRASRSPQAQETTAGARDRLTDAVSAYGVACAQRSPSLATHALEDVEQGIDDLVTALRSTHDAQITIDGVLSHWFIQGGEMQFGQLDAPLNEDDLVASILRLVRAAADAQQRQAFEQRRADLTAGTRFVQSHAGEWWFDLTWYSTLNGMLDAYLAQERP